MKAAGVTFVCRYLSYVNTLTQGKILTLGEAKTLSNAGIAIVSNYEWYGNRALEGFNSGVQDAQIASAQHLTCGGSSSRPIYFSVDVDVTGEQVAAYFKGVASIIGKARTGAYGSYRVLKYLFDAGLITWGWQTYAWSYGAWEPSAHIQQYENGVQLAGASVDYDRSTVSDFGQWLVGGLHPMTQHAPPGGWRDDGSTLYSPPSVPGQAEVPVTGLFRDYILASYPNWPAGNVALAPEYHTNVLEEQSPPADLGGSGHQIIFRYAMLCVADSGTFAGHVTFEWLGECLAYVRSKCVEAQSELATEKSQVASLVTQLQQATAQIATEQAQMKTLETELASHPDLTALANRLTTIGLEAKQASDLLAEVQQQAAQPIS